MRSEIGHRHFTAENECDWTRKEAKKQKRPENDFNQTSDS